MSQMSPSPALYRGERLSSPISPPSKISKMKSTISYLTDNRRIVKLEYRTSSIDNGGKIEFNKFELKTQADVRAMWNTYFRFETKVLLELEATISRSVEDIVKMLKRPPEY